MEYSGNKALHGTNRSIFVPVTMESSHKTQADPQYINIYTVTNVLLTFKLIKQTGPHGMQSYTAAAAVSETQK
jgi:hypothetical protein